MSTNWHQAVQNAHLIWPSSRVRILTCIHKAQARLEKLMVVDLDDSDAVKLVLFQTPWTEDALPLLHGGLCELMAAKMVREGWTTAPGMESQPDGGDGGVGNPTAPQGPDGGRDQGTVIDAESVRKDTGFFLHLTQEIVEEEGLGDGDETAFHEQLDTELETLAGRGIRYRDSVAQAALLATLRRRGKDAGNNAVMVPSPPEDAQKQEAVTMKQPNQQQQQQQHHQQHRAANSPLLGRSGSPLETYAGSGTSAGWSARLRHGGRPPTAAPPPARQQATRPPPSIHVSRSAALASVSRVDPAHSDGRAHKAAEQLGLGISDVSGTVVACGDQSTNRGAGPLERDAGETEAGGACRGFGVSEGG